MIFIKIASYTIQQRCQIVELFHENQYSENNVNRKLRLFYDLHKRLSESTIGRNIEKFQGTVLVEDQK